MKKFIFVLGLLPHITLGAAAGDAADHDDTPAVPVAAAASTSLAAGTSTEATKQLMDAVIANDSKGVKAAIAAGANINGGATFFTTPLHWAAVEGNTTIVDLLLDHGADINAADERSLKSTPLTEACMRDNYDTVALLLERGASIDKSHIVKTPLLCVIAGKSQRILEMFIAYGADVNTDDAHGSPLFRAVGTGNVHNVETLIAHGANVNYACHKTPLMEAVKQTPSNTGLGITPTPNRTRIAAILLRNGAKMYPDPRSILYPTASRPFPSVQEVEDLKASMREIKPHMQALTWDARRAAMIARARRR